MRKLKGCVREIFNDSINETFYDTIPKFSAKWYLMENGMKNIFATKSDDFKYEKFLIYIIYIINLDRLLVPFRFLYDQKLKF